MKKSRCLLLCCLVNLVVTGFAQDTLYVKRDGLTVYKVPLSNIDSISFYDTNRKTLMQVLRTTDQFGLFLDALKLTGYTDSLETPPFDDPLFDPTEDRRNLNYYGIDQERPSSRLFGFTLLLVSDQNLKNYADCPVCPNGIHSLEDLNQLAAYHYEPVYPDDKSVTDYKDKRNYLNRFVAYHIVSKRLKSSRFIKDFFTPHMLPAFPMYEYLPTLLENSLIEVKLDKSCTLENSAYGLFNTMGNQDKASLLVNPALQIESRNGTYHELSKPLFFNQSLMADLSNKRLRMDVTSFFPELANNDMRGNNPTAVYDVQGVTHAYLLPNGYLKGLNTDSSVARVDYLGANATYEDYQGDELYVSSNVGNCDFTLETLPLPAGSYEIRFGFKPIVRADYVQLYVDGVPCDSVFHLNYTATSSVVGYETPGSNPKDLDGMVNDSLMRTKGYMKAPASYYCFVSRYSEYAENARLSKNSLRKIIGTYTFEKPGKHVIRFKLVTTKPYETGIVMDYIEFMPVQLIEKEDIY